MITMIDCHHCMSVVLLVSAPTRVDRSTTQNILGLTRNLRHNFSVIVKHKKQNMVHPVYLLYTCCTHVQ